MSGFESIIGVDFWTALFTLLNMVITFALLGKFLFKPVKKMIDDRQKEIELSNLPATFTIYENEP